MAAQQEVRHGAERVQVSSPIEGLRQGHLRRNVGGRAWDQPGRGLERAGLIGIHGFDQAEVEHLHDVMAKPDATEVDVGWLDVPVHEAADVRFLERFADLLQDGNHAGGRQRTFLPDKRLQVRAFEELHREVQACRRL